MPVLAVAFFGPWSPVVVVAIFLTSLLLMYLVGKLFGPHLVSGDELIFALVLTFVYVVYFAVMITLDLHGKKDEKKSEEETYDVGDMTNEEQPVAIEERNDNPDEGDMTFIEQITDDGLRVVNPTGNVTPHSSFIEEPPITEQPSSTTSEELNEKNDEFLEHIEPEHQCSYLSEEFMQNLNNKHNTRKIEKKNARDKL